MKIVYSIGFILLSCMIFTFNAKSALMDELKPLADGPHAVGSTNMQVAAKYAGIGDEVMHDYLLGKAKANQPRYAADVLQHPESAWLIDVPVPDEPELYGPASGQTLPVLSYLTFPSVAQALPQKQLLRYAFPYYQAQHGVFENMLQVGEKPSFAEPTRIVYPACHQTTVRFDICDKAN